jgi:hypothetical protein
MGAFCITMVMTEKPRILHLLKPLLAQSMFTVADAAKCGVSRQVLAYYTKRNAPQKLDS